MTTDPARNDTLGEGRGDTRPRPPTDHPGALRGFLTASYAAKRQLARSDDDWIALRELTKAEDDATLMLLRDGYRRGIPDRLEANGEPVAARVFDILADGTKIATQVLRREKPGEFVVRRYRIPEEVLKAAGKKRVTIQFVATRWLAGGLYDVRLLRPQDDAP